MMEEDGATLFARRNLWELRKAFKVYVEGRQLIVGENPNISCSAILDFVLGGSIILGDNCLLDHYAILSSHGGKIQIGNNFSLGPHSILYGAGGLTVGNDVIIGANTVIVPANHNFGNIDSPIRNQGSSMKGVRLGNNIWVGAGCRILDGVNIGDGCVIGAGSVVTKPIPNHSIVMGVPARVVRCRK